MDWAMASGMLSRLTFGEGRVGIFDEGLRLSLGESWKAFGREKPGIGSSTGCG